MAKPQSLFVEDAAGDAKKISSTLRSLPGTRGSYKNTSSIICIHLLSKLLVDGNQDFCFPVPSGTHHFQQLHGTQNLRTKRALRPELQRVVLLTVGKPRSPPALGWVRELNRPGDGFPMI